MSPKQNIDFKIEIQCPDCGTMLELDEKREYYCKDYNRVLSESEIRTRCDYNIWIVETNKQTY